MRKKLLILLLLCLVFIFIGISSAEPVEEWHKTFGGPWSDNSYSVQQTTDGGYIIIGESKSSERNNVFCLIKTDMNGNREWDTTFNNSCCDRCFSGQQTADGGYILLGFTKSEGTLYDFWLIKTNSNGTQEWDKIFGGISFDFGYSVQQTTDEGYIVVGLTNSYGAGFADVWLIKTDSNGNMGWDRTFGGASDDRGDSVQQTSDGGYIITGRTSLYGAGFQDVWLIKTDSNGNMEWNRTFGGLGDDWGRSVQQTSDDGYIIACLIYGVDSIDVGLIKTDSDGNEEWNKTFGGAELDMGFSVQQTSDGGYIVAGGTWSYGTEGDVWLIKTDSNGNEEWNKTFGGAEMDEGRAVQQTSDGGYIIAGDTRSYGVEQCDILLLKVKGDEVGEIPTPTPTPIETPTTLPTTPIQTPVTTPKEVTQTPVTPLPSETTPGFEAMFAIVGILVIVYVLRRKG